MEAPFTAWLLLPKSTPASLTVEALPLASLSALYPCCCCCSMTSMSMEIDRVGSLSINLLPSPDHQLCWLHVDLLVV